MKKLLSIGVLSLLLSRALLAQITGDVLGAHNLSPSGTSPIQGKSSAACLYCHAPHSGIGGITPLWAQQLPPASTSYDLYDSKTIQNARVQPLLGGPSSLCLSCHDGTVAVGSNVPTGTLTMTGAMNSADVLSVHLQGTHPFSLKTPLVDAANLVPSLASTQTTADPLNAVKLIGGTVECTSCHEPHMQYLDPVSQKFLVRNSVNGAMCLACHTGNARTVNTKSNPLAQWGSSIHATSPNVVTAGAGLGAYSTVAQFACLACHRPHNANGPASLLASPTPPVTGVDAPTQSCLPCHSGSNLQTPIANVYGEFVGTGKKGHLLPAGSNLHDPSEPVLINTNNRHATCVDCHNGHSSFQVTSFGLAPGIRVSQTGIGGVSAVDGLTVLNPAANQYENCLRCHATSPGKQALQIYGYLPARAVNAADPLNVIPQLQSTSTSSHPVLHVSSNSPPPSLRQFALMLDGITNSSRQLASGSQIFCTDCHNSDDNREFSVSGGGPNGPHGSTFLHILERRYEYSQVATGAGPGTAILNLFPTPDLSAVGGLAGGPYALCAKCHDLSELMTTAHFALPGNVSGHNVHVNQLGASCSTCHIAHGMGSVSANIAGDNLVNFDVNVVAANGTPPTISYSHSPSLTCVLVCHAYKHNSDGTVTMFSPVVKPLQNPMRRR